MKPIQKKTMLYDAIVRNNKLLPIFNRFGITLGFGDKNIETACFEKRIGLNFFIEIVNTFQDKNYFPKSKLTEFSVSQIIEYLKNTHLYYVNYILPDFEKQLTLIKLSGSENVTDFELLNKFYKKYKHELWEHINDEDKNVFPYALAVEKLAENEMTFSQFNNDFESFSVSDFDKEHTNMETKMSDLKSLIIKYLPPVFDQNLCQKFLFSLMRFEEDLKDHARIEDKILVPKIKILENRIVKN